MLSSSDPRSAAAGALRCTVHRDRERSSAIVVPCGELDIATAPALDAELTRLRAEGFRRLVVDLRALTFIESTGIHVLLRWAREQGRLGRSFSVVPGSQRVQMVLAMTGVLELLTCEGP
jgi:anti-sigma B factor antagonist